jgi:hypothetical protein
MMFIRKNPNYNKKTLIYLKIEKKKIKEMK